MQHHYQIVSSFDPTDVVEDTRNGNFPGFGSGLIAETAGEEALKKYNPDQYYVKPVTVVESSDIDWGKDWENMTDEEKQLYVSYKKINALNYSTKQIEGLYYLDSQPKR